MDIRKQSECLTKSYKMESNELGKEKSYGFFYGLITFRHNQRGSGHH